MITSKDRMEFAFAMGRHSRASIHECRRLLRYAATYQRLEETACNRELTAKESAKLENVEKCIRLLVEGFESKVNFQSDPSGWCVKVRTPDGYRSEERRVGK